MNPFRLIAVIFMGLAVSGCASVETATRNAPLEAPQIQAAPVSFDVKEIRVSVPETLRVSEANRNNPAAISCGAKIRRAIAMPKSKPFSRRPLYKASANWSPAMCLQSLMSKSRAFTH
ncbi:MAG TPA: hypothetical protein VJ942_04955 [Roseovarius sp.]|nr:hypothetical protein [Roseovarius sp.]